MTEIIKYIFEGKVSSRIWILLATLSGFLLLASSFYINILGLASLKVRYGEWLGIVFLISSAFILIRILYWFFNKISFEWKWFWHKKNIQRNVYSMDLTEKYLLREFYLQNRDTLALPFIDPTVASLISKGILRQVGNYGENHYGSLSFNFSISKYARKYLSYEFFSLSVGNRYNEFELAEIRNSRPQYLLGR